MYSNKQNGVVYSGERTMNPNQLALLIAAPQEGEPAMHNDMTAMTQALLDRGLSADRILSLHGRLDRTLVLACLRTVRRRITLWENGSLFIHVSGDGFFIGDTSETARAGLLFDESNDVTDDGHLFWDNFFAALNLPTGIRLILLPDL
ncbi:MAG: hypothetical protein KBG20_00280 [Caldilineaceae bacterium]|nr:hypothetical protein [Caldilineaceae bacterium]MBP8121389.1 hypothetical protein [Caldilineaceae bacterium]MBP9070694.1 hypothetical protein [Caldilineaceae bacterium]